jgi:hypothetical protein
MLFDQDRVRLLVVRSLLVQQLALGAALLDRPRLLQRVDDDPDEHAASPETPATSRSGIKGLDDGEDGLYVTTPGVSGSGAAPDLIGTPDSPGTPLAT